MEGNQKGPPPRPNSPTSPSSLNRPPPNNKNLTGGGLVCLESRVTVDIENRTTSLRMDFLHYASNNTANKIQSKSSKLKGGQQVLSLVTVSRALKKISHARIS